MYYLLIYLQNMCSNFPNPESKKGLPCFLSIFLRRSLGTFFFTSQPLTPLEVFGSPSHCPLQWQEPTSVSIDIPWMTVFQYVSTKSHLGKLILFINRFPSFHFFWAAFVFTFMHVFLFSKSSWLNHRVYRSKIRMPHSWWCLGTFTRQQDMSISPK